MKRRGKQLAAERAAFASKGAALAGNLVAEKARVDQAIAALSALAERARRPGRRAFAVIVAAARR
jgi:hypothetical protein